MCVTFVETIINNMSAAAENSKKGLLSTKKIFYKVIPLAVFKNCISDGKEFSTDIPLYEKRTIMISFCTLRLVQCRTFFFLLTTLSSVLALTS